MDSGGTHNLRVPHPVGGLLDVQVRRDEEHVLVPVARRAADKLHRAVLAACTPDTVIRAPLCWAVGECGVVECRLSAA